MPNEKNNNRTIENLTHWLSVNKFSVKVFQPQLACEGEV